MTWLRRLDYVMSWRQVRWTIRSFFFIAPALIYIGLYGWDWLLLLPFLTIYGAGVLDQAVVQEEIRERKQGRPTTGDARG